MLQYFFVVIIFVAINGWESIYTDALNKTYTDFIHPLKRLQAQSRDSADWHDSTISVLNTKRSQCGRDPRYQNYSTVKLVQNVGQNR